MRKFSGMFTFVFFITFFGALCGSFTARAGQGPILIVFNMEDRGSGLDTQVLTNLSDYLAVLMAEGGYQVVPRSQVRDRIKQQQLESKKECYDQSCQVELGRELAAQKSLATQIFKIGGVCRVTASLFDLRKAATEKAASAGGSCEEKELLAAVEQIAKKMAIGSGGKVDAAAKAEKARKAEEARKAAEQARKAELARKAEEKAREEEKARKAEEARKAAEQARKAELARKAEEKARAQEKARKAEQAKKTAEQAQLKKQQQDAKAATGDFSVKNLWWNLTLKFSVLMPSFSDDNGIWITFEPSGTGVSKDGSIRNGLGGMFDIGADFKLGSYFSIGPSVLVVVSGGEEMQPSPSEGLWSYLSLGARFKGRFALGNRWEIRPCISVALGIMPDTDEFIFRISNDEDVKTELDGSLGLSLEFSLEAVYYLWDSAGILADIGIVGQPLGKLDKEITSVDFGPFMYFGLGLEFGG